jgi:hypothetical protein
MFPGPFSIHLLMGRIYVKLAVSWSQYLDMFIVINNGRQHGGIILGFARIDNPLPERQPAGGVVQQGLPLVRVTHSKGTRPHPSHAQLNHRLLSLRRSPRRATPEIHIALRPVSPYPFRIKKALESQYPTATVSAPFLTSKLYLRGTEL